MGKIYHHFSKWEDYKNGFYDSICVDKDTHIEKSISLLSDQKRFYDVATKLVNTWKYSVEHNLTDKTINRLAYIGQASCCIENKTPSFITKIAWGFIDVETRQKANDTAKIVLEEWLSKRNCKDEIWD